MAKEYYWIKLSEGFFDDVQVKLIRALPEGDSLCIIYQRLMIMCLKDRGYYRFNHILPSAADELAALLGEETKKVTYAYTILQNMGLIELADDDTLYIAAVEQFFGKETDAAGRMRKMREQRKKQVIDSPPETKCVTSTSHCYIDILDNKDNIDNINNIDSIDNIYNIYNNIYNNISNNSSSSRIDINSIENKITVKQFVQKYNSICCCLPRVEEITKERRRLIRNAVDMLRKKGVEIDTFFRRVNASDFLCGRIPGKDFRAHFDFILQEHQLLKIIEGLYDNSGGFNDEAAEKKEFDFDDLIEKSDDQK